jgi:hypothetical protein
MNFMNRQNIHKKKISIKKIDTQKRVLIMLTSQTPKLKVGMAAFPPKLPNTSAIFYTSPHFPKGQKPFLEVG